MDTDLPLTPSALLAEMAQLAANIARAWAPVAQLQARQAEQGTLDPEVRDAAKVFNSVTRTLRQTLALHAKLQQPAAPARPREPASRGQAELRRQVERAIAEQAEPQERENLLADLYERLDCEDFERDFATVPLAEAIEIICRDLGLHVADQAVAPVAPAVPALTPSDTEHESPWQKPLVEPDRPRIDSGSDPPPICC